MGTYEGAFCPHLLSSVPSNILWCWAVESRTINNPGFYRSVLGTFRSAHVFVIPHIVERTLERRCRCSIPVWSERAFPTCSKKRCDVAQRIFHGRKITSVTCRFYTDGERENFHTNVGKENFYTKAGQESFHTNAGKERSYRRRKRIRGLMNPMVDGSMGPWVQWSMGPRVDKSKGRWIHGWMDPRVVGSKGRYRFKTGLLQL